MTLHDQAEKMSVLYKQYRRRHKATKIFWLKLRDMRTRALKVDLRGRKK